MKRIRIEPGVVEQRPDEPTAPCEIVVGDIVVLRRAVASPYPFIAYPANSPRRWTTLLWGRSDWAEVCHLLGIHPCRIECLRNPASWPGELPSWFDGLTPDELVLFREAQITGRSLLSNRSGSPPPSKPAADPREPRPVLHMEFAPRAEDPEDPFGLPPFQGDLF